VQNYGDAQGSLPPTGGTGTGLTQNDYSMKGRILPNIEPSAIYNAINFGCRFNYPQNLTASTASINSYLCPSDGNNPNYTVTLNGISVLYGQCNYGHNVGVSRSFNGGTDDGPAWLPGQTVGAATRYGPVVNLASVVDGTSNTAIFSEWIKGKGTTQNGLNMVYSSTITFSTSAPSPAITGGSLQSTLQNLAATCTSRTATTFTQKGAFWAYEGMGSGGGYVHSAPPNKLSCQYSGQGTGNTPDLTTEGMIGAQSYHSGGVNVGFLDGSVKFIKDSVNLGTWGALGTMAGGEVIDASGY
jgi:prepilin-type processing-associated H-X9-DG protein